jgi:UDP-glucose 4-epimerase
MKKILITGKDSYIGTSFEKYMSQWPGEYIIDTLDMKDPLWKEYNFKGYDAVFHVAGIAHADVGKVKKEDQQRYYDVNTNLTFEVASKSKSEGVKQFIFMSSMIVYSGCKEKIITRETEPKPLNFYGDSKLQAEKKLESLIEESFKVAIIRPPMIYGSGSRGNYKTLSRLAQKSPIFPKVKNKRSMLYVGNLNKFVKFLVCNEEAGVFFPQNDEYVNTSELVKAIANFHGHKIYIIPGLNILTRIMIKFPGKIGNISSKVFGDYIYDKELSSYNKKHLNVSFEKSIEITEKML